MNKWTALHWSMHRGHDKVSELLLASGADAAATNASGKTPVDIAKASTRDTPVPKGASFVPNYLANPNIGKKFASIEPQAGQNQPTAPPPPVSPASVADSKRNPARHDTAPVSVSPVSVAPVSVAPVAVAPSRPTFEGIRADSQRVLVYDGPERLVGAVLMDPTDSIADILLKVYKELDIQRENLLLHRSDGARMIPLPVKQFTQIAARHFYPGDAIVLLT